MTKLNDFERWDWTGVHPDMDPRFNVAGDWTADRVRAELPSVPVALCDGDRVTCALELADKLCVAVVLPDGRKVEVLPRTAAGALNANRPLRGLDPDQVLGNRQPLRRGASDVADNWTADRVRDLLPEVPVALDNGDVARCGIAGRRNRFATVFLPAGGTVEAAWSTLAHILNDDRRALKL